MFYFKKQYIIIKELIKMEFLNPFITPLIKIIDLEGKIDYRQR